MSLLSSPLTCPQVVALLLLFLETEALMAGAGCIWSRLRVGHTGGFIGHTRESPGLKGTVHLGVLFSFLLVVRL